MNFYKLSLVLAALGWTALSSPVFGELEAAPAANDEEADEEESPSGFERYQSIIDRMPFGEPPPGFDATLPPGSAAAAAQAAAAQANGEMTPEQRTEEEQRLASAVRVSILNITPAGRTMVGFTDSSAQPPEHYYLPVGGEKNGWEVKEADPASEKVTLVHEGVEVTVKLGEGASGDGKGKGKAAVQRPLMNMARRGVALDARPMGMGAPGAGAPGAANAMPAGGPGGGAMARLRARRMQQQQEEAKRRSEAAEEAKAERERRAAEAEQAAAEREQQRNALLQIQEELRRQREEKAAARAEENAGQQNEQAQE